MGREGRKETTQKLVTVLGELNDIHIVYNPKYYGQHVPLHFPSIWAHNSVPSASRAILVFLRITSLAQSWASRAVMAILGRISVVILRHCRMGAQHVGRWTIILAAPQRCGGG